MEGSPVMTEREVEVPLVEEPVVILAVDQVVRLAAFFVSCAVEEVANAV